MALCLSEHKEYAVIGRHAAAPHQAHHAVVAGRKLTIYQGEFRLKFDQGF
jgi:hypothetical protein